MLTILLVFSQIESDCVSNLIALGTLGIFWGFQYWCILGYQFYHFIRGAHHSHGKTENSGWKIKWFTSFCLKRFVHYGPQIVLINVLPSVQSSQYS